MVPGVEGVDTGLYRRVIGRFATGVTVITSLSKGKRFATTANSFTSVSLDPMLLLVCFSHDSATGAATEESGRFIVNLLGSTDGEKLARRFAVKALSHEDQLDGEAVFDYTDLPALAKAIAWFSCSVDKIVTAGDHKVVIANVEAVCEDNSRRGESLIFHEGSFRHLERGTTIH